MIILMDIRRTSNFSATRFSIQFSHKSTIYNHNYLLYIEYYNVTAKMLIQEMSERVRKRKAEWRWKGVVEDQSAICIIL